MPKNDVEEALRRIDECRERGETTLDLSSMGLTELPKPVFDLTALTTLDLSFNNLTALQPEIGALTALTELRVSHNRLTSLPPEIGTLTVLTKLDASFNRLNALPPEIGALSALTKLFVSFNNLTALPPEIGALSTLTVLLVTKNGLTALPPEIGTLSALTVLLVSDNSLTALPPEIGALTALAELDVSDNELTTLPPEIGALTALKELDLGGNDLTALPPEIGTLTALTKLYMSDNSLTALPPEIGALTTLTELIVLRNELTALPPEIGALTTLTELIVSFNNLTALPPEIGALSTLTKLYISNNNLTALPPEIGTLTALTELYINYNNLTKLPREIGALTTLTELIVPRNELTALPPEIGALTALAKLDLSGNQLTALPPEIGALTALATLHVSDNQLTALPPEIYELKALDDFHVSTNQLTALSPEIGKLTALRNFTVNDNRLRDPPQRIVEQGLPAIERYFAFKERKRRGGWVAVGSRLSRHFRLRTYFAALLTAGMSIAALALAHYGVSGPLWIAAAIAPLLLLKTRASVALGISRFAWLMRKLNLKQNAWGVSALLLPARLLALGVGSVLIKAVTTPYFLIRNPSAALKAMPANLKELCLEIDLACPPELIPGLEQAYDRDPDGAFLFTDLMRPYDRRLGYLHYRFGDTGPSRSTLLSAPVLAVFFAIATVYRLYVKMAAVFYIGLLFVEPPSRRRMAARAAESARPPGTRTKMRIQMAIAGLALYGLLHLAGETGLQAAVAGWLDEKLLAVWEATNLSEWLPKSVLTLLFLQASVYLVGAGAEATARWAAADTGDRRLSAVAQRRLGIAYGFYMIHVGLIVVLAVAIFIALAPNVILLLDLIWRLFF